MYCICDPGEEEIRRTFLREAAECVDPVRCKKVQRLKSTGAKAASLGAGMLLQKMALDLIDGTENTGILFLEEDELLAVLQERMHRDKAGALSFSYEYGELGKPQIVNIPKKFNLSHSGDYVVCAVGDGEVGADIQKWVPYKERTAERFLRQRNGNCCRNCLRHSARNCFTDCGAEKNLRQIHRPGDRQCSGRRFLRRTELAGKQICFWERVLEDSYSLAVCYGTAEA